jgi:hypothetical protein
MPLDTRLSYGFLGDWGAWSKEYGWTRSSVKKKLKVHRNTLKKCSTRT